MEVGVGVAGEGQRRQARGVDLDAEFLAQFPDQRVLGPLAGLQLAAGKLPEARELFAFGTLGDQHAIVGVDERDGEGARKFIEVRVDGAASRKAAKRIALSIANSPLVKTACAGEDANWGRVVMAVGKAGEKAERDKLDIYFGDIRVAHQGLRDPAYNEADTSAYMKRPKIVIGVKLGIGSARAKVWTCDLTKEYVAINGDYRS